MIKSKKIIRIRRGLYIPGGEVFYSTKTLANKIFGPSYISFEYALSYYGFIPEKVETITSAVYNKNKKRTFRTPVGTFLYKSVPDTVYHKGITRKEENSHPYLIATAEKALLDTLYQHRSINTISQLSDLIYKDLRLDTSVISELDIKALEEIAFLYGNRIFKIFI